MENCFMKIIVASNNMHKIEEIKTTLKDFNIEVLSLKDVNINVDPEENGKTFKENAFIKANEIAKFTNEIIVADDSGLEIEALDGFPGIYSSRFLENKSYEEKFVAINKMLEGKNNRKANYTCALCILNLEKEPIYIEGKVFGTLLQEPQGEQGFGYDPIFYYEPYQCTFAQIDQQQKNKVSHRGEAIKQFVELIKKHNEKI